MTNSPLQSPKTPESAADRWAAVNARIAAAAAATGRAPDSVRLVAVSKTKSAAEIMPTLEAGQRLFGENRVQEAAGKWPALRSAFPEIELHLIGPLQTNKVADAVALFDAIETLDREKLARALAGEMAKQGRRPACFIQVNTGEEPQKAGVLPGETDAFVTLCRDDYSLAIEGLMCIPPLDEEPSLHFALLAKIAARLGLKELSMGMSGDFTKAISFGATYVRIGTAIFEVRDAN